MFPQYRHRMRFGRSSAWWVVDMFHDRWPQKHEISEPLNQCASGTAGPLHCGHAKRVGGSSRSITAQKTNRRHPPMQTTRPTQ
jgi:hypothetical protein